MKTQRIISFITLAAAAGAGTACTDEEPIPFPATCAEYKANTGTVIDYTYDLYVNHDPSMKWTAFCSGMSTDDPVEYLPLARTGGTYNYSTVENTISATQTETVKTHYTRLRIDPIDLTVDIGDRGGAETDESTVVDSDTVDGVAFGLAVVCNSDTAPFGVSKSANANIDLAGTRFALSRDTDFCTEKASSPSPAMSTDSGRVELSVTSDSMLAAGACAFASLANPCPNRPWLPDTDGFQLQLQYVP